MLSRDPESEFDSFIMEEEQCIVMDMQYQIQTPDFQMSSAMDYDSILYNCQTHFPQSQYTVASPDLSTGTCKQLPLASLPATSPLPSAPLQPEGPPITTTPGANAQHSEILVACHCNHTAQTGIVATVLWILPR